MRRLAREELIAAFVVGVVGLFLTLSVWAVADRVADRLPLSPLFQARIRHVHDRGDGGSIASSRYP